MDIKDRIEQLIIDSGKPRREIVKAIAKDSSNFNRMIKSPSYPTIKKLANALGVTCGELFDDYKTPEPIEIHSVIINGIEYVPKPNQ